MVTMYLPTVYWPYLWPCAVLLLVFIPVSIWHQVHWSRTVAEYAALRRSAGAPDEPWPTRDLRWVLSLQPWLLILVASLLAVMVVTGLVAMVVWPHRLFRFGNILNYYDRPYLASMLVAGIAAVIGVTALAIDLLRSPWKGVAAQVRRAVHASPSQHESRLQAALKLDPGVPAESGVGDDVARSDVLREPAVGDLEDAIGPLGD
jgi:hypothetical protein